MKHFLVGFLILVFGIFSKAQVSIQVNVPAIVPNSEVTIEIKINKGAVSNFAKYQMDVPAGVYISEGDNKTGSFSFENNRAKIIWVSVPVEPEFVVTMKLNPGSATGMGVINQKFYYLEGGTRKEVEVAPITLNFSGGPAVSSTNSSPAPESTVSGSNTATTVPESVSPPATVPSTSETSTGADNNAISELTTGAAPADPPKPLTETKESSSESIRKLKEQFDAANAPVESKTPVNPPAAVKSANSPSAASPASSGVTSYKIQIGAYGEKPGMARYNSLKGVNIVKEDNFYKVLVGNFKNREDAAKMKEELISKGFKGFVVTYQNGSRVR